MLSFEASEIWVAELAEQLPQEILDKLNCGIILLPDVLYDDDGLLILGQYHVDPMGLGRYVTINYGSVVAAHGHLGEKSFKEKLKGVLYHELTHHLESLAGDRSLEVQDAIDRHKMLRGYRRRLIR